MTASDSAERSKTRDSLPVSKNHMKRTSLDEYFHGATYSGKRVHECIALDSCASTSNSSKTLSTRALTTDSVISSIIVPLDCDSSAPSIRSISSIANKELPLHEIANDSAVYFDDIKACIDSNPSTLQCDVKKVKAPKKKDKQKTKKTSKKGGASTHPDDASKVSTKPKDLTSKPSDSVINQTTDLTSHNTKTENDVGDTVPSETQCSEKKTKAPKKKDKPKTKKKPKKARTSSDAVDGHKVSAKAKHSTSKPLDDVIKVSANSKDSTGKPSDSVIENGTDSKKNERRNEHGARKEPRKKKEAKKAKSKKKEKASSVSSKEKLGEHPKKNRDIKPAPWDAHSIRDQKDNPLLQSPFFEDGPVIPDKPLLDKSSEEVSENDFVLGIDDSERRRQGLVNHAPRTTQSTRRASCYYSALSTYGFSEKTTRMKAERIEAFFFNSGMTISLAILFCALNVIVAAHGAYQFTAAGGFTTDNDILRVTLPIARAGGRLVTFNCAVLLLTACKGLWTMIRTYVVPIIPIGFPIDDIMPKYHRVVGLCIIVSGCIVHTLPQVVNYATGAIWTVPTGGKIWTWGKGLAQTQLLITGSLLTVIFTTFFFTTRITFRKTTAGFRWFWFFHTGGIALAYPLLIVHGTCRGNPLFLYCALSPLALYLLDITLRRSNVTKAEVLDWKTHEDRGNRITELVLQCPPNVVYTPGQYVELKFDSISTHEWHPFTIASAPNRVSETYDGTKVLMFFIKATGRWTEALYNYASAFDLSRAIEPTTMAVRGPHGAPIVNFSEYKHIVLVGAGVGVTPLLSVWQHLVGEGRSKIQGQQESPIPEFIEEDFEENTSKFRSICLKIERVLDSLTASICLLFIFVAGETIVSTTLVFGYYTEAFLVGNILACFSLIFHGGAIIASAFANGCDIQYFLSFKCWIEVAIIVFDGINFFLALSALVGTIEDESEVNTASLLGLASMTVFLHALRIFHTFHRTLKPKNRSSKRKARNRISSVVGIFINTSHAGMRFTFEHLLQPLHYGLSNAFSLHFYGTRETDTSKTFIESVKDDIESSRHSMRYLAEGTSTGTEYDDKFFRFRVGRPDWELVFRKQILKVHSSCPQGDSIGVFFCGSPAISKVLNEVADQVSAQHRHSVKMSCGTACKCKIVVHTENY